MKEVASVTINAKFFREGNYEVLKKAWRLMDWKTIRAGRGMIDFLFFLWLFKKLETDHKTIPLHQRCNYLRLIALEDGTLTHEYLQEKPLLGL